MLPPIIRYTVLVLNPIYTIMGANHDVGGDHPPSKPSMTSLEVHYT